MLCVWMLRDGTMVNGSYEGRQRDIDHRCISEYFKASKRQSPGSALIYIEKFMRRGNIRYTFNEFGYSPELACVPTPEQFKRMQEHVEIAMCNNIHAGVSRFTRDHKRIYMRWPEYTEHLRRYTDLITDF